MVTPSYSEEQQEYDVKLHLQEFIIPTTFQNADEYVAFFENLMNQENLIKNYQEKVFHEGTFKFVEVLSITTRIVIKASKTVNVTESSTLNLKMIRSKGKGEEGKSEELLKEVKFDGIVNRIQHISETFIEIFVDINLKSPIDYHIQKNLPKKG